MLRRRIITIFMTVAICMAIAIPAFATGYKEYTIKAYDGTPAKEGRVIDAISCYNFDVNKIADLEEIADIIIRGKVLPEQKVMNIPRYGDSLGIGYMFTEVEVIEVFSGDVEVGDVIDLIEYCHEAKNAGELYLVTSDGYLPSEPETEYIFFLRKDNSDSPIFGGKYEGIRSHMGRYPIPEVNEEIVHYSLEDQIRAIPNSKFDVLSSTNTTIYRNVYNEVIDKYIENN